LRHSYWDLTCSGEDRSEIGSLPISGKQVIPLRVTVRVSSPDQLHGRRLSNLLAAYAPGLSRGGAGLVLARPPVDLAPQRGAERSNHGRLLAAPALAKESRCNELEVAHVAKSVLAPKKLSRRNNLRQASTIFAP